MAGQRYRVSFGNQQLTGLLISIDNHCSLPLDKLKAAEVCLDEQAALSPGLLKLLLWTASYYQQPIGEVISTALPALLRQGQSMALSPVEGWAASHTLTADTLKNLKRAPKQLALANYLLQTTTEEQRTSSHLNQLGFSKSLRDALVEKGLITRQESLPTPPDNRQPLLSETPLELTAEQTSARNLIPIHKFNCTLLYGATGSGKTEVYLQLIEKVLRQGLQVLLLVPEIGLTPQSLQRVQQRFARTIYSLHSGLNDSERLQTWKMAKNGHASIVVGTRSAIFTDFKQLGLIIVDEEHDLSFKQQEGVRYSARDIAIIRAHHLNIPVVLGSATPSMESLHNAATGRYQLAHLHRRPGSATPPSIQFTDMRNQTLYGGLTESTLRAIESTLQKGEQALVFLNRRGYAPTLMCHHCGWVGQCRHCDARLTLHHYPKHLRCHHCDFQRPIPRQCPDCQNPHLQAMGQGTEQTEDVLQQRFPQWPVLRVDRDSTRRKNAMANLLERIHQGEPAILVGTQMLAKGHHFPKVTLVVIADADANLFSSDFRGPERMGQLLTQVAGRAGREALAGTVIIQTYHPDHPGLDLLAHKGYQPYAQQILTERQSAQMPPYNHLAYLRAESKRSDNAMQLLQRALSLTNQIISDYSLTAHLLGPLPAPVEKKNDRFRYLLQINSPKRPHLQQLLSLLIAALETEALAKRCRWNVDVDPQEQS